MRIQFVARVFRHGPGDLACYVPKYVHEFYKIEPGRSAWSDDDVWFRLSPTEEWTKVMGYLSRYANRNGVRVLFSTTNDSNPDLQGQVVEFLVDCRIEQEFVRLGEL